MSDDVSGCRCCGAAVPALSLDCAACDARKADVIFLIEVLTTSPRAQPARTGRVWECSPEALALLMPPQVHALDVKREESALTALKMRDRAIYLTMETARRMGLPREVLGAATA